MQIVMVMVMMMIMILKVVVVASSIKILKSRNFFYTSRIFNYNYAYCHGRPPSSSHFYYCSIKWYCTFLTPNYLLLRIIQVHYRYRQSKRELHYLNGKIIIIMIDYQCYFQPLRLHFCLFLSHTPKIRMVVL